LRFTYKQVNKNASPAENKLSEIKFSSAWSLARKEFAKQWKSYGQNPWLSYLSKQNLHIKFYIHELVTLTTAFVDKLQISIMRKSFFLTSTFIFLFCMLTRAQFTETVKSQLVKEWERAKVYTLEYLDSMPKDKYGFKAQDSIRSFSQQMLHLAEDIVIMVSYGTGKRESGRDKNWKQELQPNLPIQ